MLLTRSIRIKIGILALLLALAVVRETDWARRTFGLDDYWERESVRRELVLREAEADLAAARAEPLPAGELEAAEAEVEQLRRALAEARSKL